MQTSTHRSKTLKQLGTYALETYALTEFVTRTNASHCLHASPD